MNAREIRTGRLLLRPFRETDFDDLYEFLAQLRDDEFEGYPGITRENGREHLAYRLGSEEFCAIELTGSGKVIGNIYCGDRDFAAREVGYIVNERYRRQGYAAEAVSAVIAQAFKEGAHRICAECDPRNVPSWKLLERMGMRREAHFRRNIWSHRDMNGAPVWKDTLIYAILEGEDAGSWPHSDHESEPHGIL
ncbi:MAG: GNAT family N-acetyltransferase [Clostridia bacterium]|nr:GNAT family N-acetyltransferase [Clostridia bacterium]